MQAFIDGERDPQVLADLAKQKLRLKHDVLVEALTGRFNDHHAFLCAIILRRIHKLSAVIEEVTVRIDTELASFADTVEHLVTIPGIDCKGAAVIIAKTGGDLTRFRTAVHLTSGAEYALAATNPAGSKSQESGESATKHSELPWAS